MRFALVDESFLVANVVLWDGVTNWTPPDSLSALNCDNFPDVAPGCTFDGQTVTPADPPPDPEPSVEERLQSLVDVLVTKSVLKAEDVKDASINADPIDALPVDGDVATEVKQP